jgi:hypothetical protein
VNTIGLNVCEVCGTQSLDHSGWFSIAGAGRQMEIVPWTDSVGERNDCRHACCGDHLQKLLFNSAIEECSTSFNWFSSTHRGAWNAAALVPPSPQAANGSESIEDSIIKIVGEIDAVLGSSAEDEDQPSFDA